MENADALREALGKLVRRRQASTEAIMAMRTELGKTEAELEALRAKGATLATKLQKAEASFERLNATIIQTEDGYQRMIDTAQTLMDVVAMQMPALEEDAATAAAL